jgi:predicted dithiol-disulfide oxidoreductase (DUF899 family)
MIGQDAPKIVAREEWLSARRELLVREKELTRQLDAVRAARRQLPWVEVNKPYVFEGMDGKRTLAELFDGRSQLAVYHFMLTPGSEHICNGCALVCDHVDAARQHFEQADLSFAAVSRAPSTQIAAVKRRMGWTFEWVSSHGSDFNYDFGVSFTEVQIAAGKPLYNFGTSPYLELDLPGASIFARDDSGCIYHTYSTYTRGLELFVGAFNWLDLTPKGRNEVGRIMSWVRLHDEYETRPTDRHDCCR